MLQTLKIVLKFASLIHYFWVGELKMCWLASLAFFGPLQIRDFRATTSTISSSDNNIAVTRQQLAFLRKRNLQRQT